MSDSTQDDKVASTLLETQGNDAKNWMIGATLFLAAAIIFGLLYLFVIAPTVPGGSAGWFLFSFATGLTMIVMPCTLPLAFVIVPLSMGKGIVRGLGMALAFGIGVAVMLSTYGIIAALLGGVALDFLGNDIEAIKNWVYFFAGSFALVFALSEIGLLNIHMPSYSGAAPAFIQKRGEIIKAFLLGLFLGNVGVGCPHPATPLILIEIASSGDVLYGWLMFLIHAIGRVLPLLLLAFLAVLGVNGLNWLMERKATVEKVTGWGMVFVAGFILTLGLFTHDWWVNSGIHNALESVTQESFFNSWFNEALDQDVAHVHGIEEGQGLFGQPLEWGHWFLVLVWLIPIWWWYSKRRKEVIVTEGELDVCDVRVLKMQKNYLIAISIALVLIFAHFMPTNFYLASMSGMGHDDHADDHSDAHGHEDEFDVSTAHMMDGVLMDAMGNVLEGAHMMPDGTIMFNDGSLYESAVIERDDAFSSSIDGLEDAVGPQLVELSDGDSYQIIASYVKKEVGNRTLRMMAYNKSIPGPFIKAPEGSQVTINFTNETDIDQTIHSHGVRLDNLYDGVPNLTQKVVAPGETYTYIIDFPEASVSWYHPHTRDDYGQEMGLYGVYIVESLNEDYWNPVNREIPLVIDDILIENDNIAKFYKGTIDHALLGRFGNEYLVNGVVNFDQGIQKGEVVRLQLTNVSNARTYNLSIPGAQMKLVGAELGRFESETFTDTILISPAERMIVEVHFPDSGMFNLTNSYDDKTFTLSTFTVSDNEVTSSYEESFNVARVNQPESDEFEAIRANHLSRDADKNILLTLELTGQVDHSAHAHGATGDESGMEDMPMMGDIDLQWDDPTNSDKVNTIDNVEWIIVDQDTGKKSMGIDDWVFTEGQQVKMRITNDRMAAHVMQHPYHIHGQRFVVLSENGIPVENMAWKDTAIVRPGEYIDILVDMSNTGEWMAHCHISEHLHAGMMMQFRVEDADGNAAGDAFRAILGDMEDTDVHSEDFHTHEENEFTYLTEVDESVYTVTPSATSFKEQTVEFLTLSITDSNGKSVALSSNVTPALKVTFVDSTGENTVVTYPGNTAFDNYEAPHGAPGHDNSDGHHDSAPTMPADDRHDHIHMAPENKTFVLTNIAYADGGADHMHDVSNMKYTYTVPVVFPAKGNYKAFVEFIPDGTSEYVVETFGVEIRTSAFSVDNLGWSQTQKWWILLMISIALIVPLCLGVRKYINKKI